MGTRTTVETRPTQLSEWSQVGSFGSVTRGIASDPRDLSSQRRLMTTVSLCM